MSNNIEYFGHFFECLRIDKKLTDNNTFYTNLSSILFILEPLFYSRYKEIIMKNRCRNEIITSILEVVSRGESTRTKIMYGAFLSYTQLNEYISFLLDKDLISYRQRQQQRNKRTPSFMITEKGSHFLMIHSQINEMVTTTIQTK